MALSLIKQEDFGSFLQQLRTIGKVYWNKEVNINWNKKGGAAKKYSLMRLKEEEIDDYEIPPYRSSEGLKPLLFRPRRGVAEYPGSSEAKVEDIEDIVVFGVKACDLVAMKTYDAVFIEDEEFVDPYYKVRREKLFIVSSDCTDSCETCFCTLLGDKPYPVEEYFDLNITILSDGYLVESGSERGAEFLAGVKESKDGSSYSGKRDDVRSKVERKVIDTNMEFGTERAFDELVIDNYDSDAWMEPGSRCVMCGACTNVCPTCFCHILFDRKGEREKFVRLMAWDSCAYQGFSAMAGGLNPRYGMLDRFKHRYNHKYHHFVKQYGMIACSGCGRCIENCMGLIDMRAVISSVEKSTTKVES